MIDQLPICRFFARYSLKSEDVFLFALFIIIVCFLYGYSHTEHMGQQLFVFWICCHTLNFTFYVTSDANGKFIGKSFCLYVH